MARKTIQLSTNGEKMLIEVLKTIFKSNYPRASGKIPIADTEKFLAQINVDIQQGNIKMSSGNLIREIKKQLSNIIPDLEKDIKTIKALRSSEKTISDTYIVELSKILDKWQLVLVSTTFDSIISGLDLALSTYKLQKQFILDLEKQLSGSDAMVH